MSLQSKFVMPRSMVWVALIGLTAAPFSYAQDKTPVTRTQTTAPLAKKDPSPKKDTGAAKADGDDAKPAESAGGGRGGRDRGKGDAPEKKEKTVYDFELPGSDGKGVPLASFKGKTLITVGLGCACVFFWRWILLG